MITFQHPENFWMIMAAGAAILFGYLIAVARGSRVLRYLGGRQLLRERGSRIQSLRIDFIRAFVVVSVFLLFAGAYWLGPQLEKISEIPIYEGAEVCFAIDASRSSLAKDIRFTDRKGQEQIVSRFNFAKTIVQEAQTVLSSDDAPCLLFFAGSAINTVPIFNWADVAWEYIRSDLRFADEYFVEHEIPQGSDFAALMIKTLSAFSERPTRKILVVISDGEPESGEESKNIDQKRDDALKQLKEKARKELRDFRKSYEFIVEFIGVGDISKASTIPKRAGKDDKVIENHKFISGAKKGQQVLTRPDPAFLLEAAQSLGGKYRHARDLDDARASLSTILAHEKRILDWRQNKNITEIWQYFVAAGLVLMFTVPFLKSP